MAAAVLKYFFVPGITIHQFYFSRLATIISVAFVFNILTFDVVLIDENTVKQQQDRVDELVELSNYFFHQSESW